jgi:opacity protein-like surface antigen
MKFKSVLALLMFISPAVAMAQGRIGSSEMNGDVPRVEIAGAYSYIHASASGFNVSAPLGFDANTAFNVNSWFGVEGNLAYNRKSQSGAAVSLTSYTVGPRFTYRSGRLAVFAHALVGGERLSAGGFGFSAATNAVAYGGGGGVSFTVSKHFAIRAAEVDYLTGSKYGTRLNTIRVGTGVVARF